jgi:hypothetical protein
VDAEASAAPPSDESSIPIDELLIPIDDPQFACLGYWREVWGDADRYNGALAAWRDGRGQLGDALAWARGLTQAATRRHKRLERVRKKCDQSRDDVAGYRYITAEAIRAIKENADSEHLTWLRQAVVDPTDPLDESIRREFPEEHRQPVGPDLPEIIVAIERIPGWHHRLVDVLTRAEAGNPDAGTELEATLHQLTADDAWLLALADLTDDCQLALFDLCGRLARATKTDSPLSNVRGAEGVRYGPPGRLNPDIAPTAPSPAQQHEFERRVDTLRRCLAEARADFRPAAVHFVQAYLASYDVFVPPGVVAADDAVPEWLQNARRVWNAMEAAERSIGVALTHLDPQHPELAMVALNELEEFVSIAKDLVGAALLASDPYHLWPDRSRGYGGANRDSAFAWGTVATELTEATGKHAGVLRKRLRSCRDWLATHR